MLNWKKIAAIIIRCLIGFGVLVYLFKKLDISHIFSAISNADIASLLIGFSVVFAARILRAWQLAEAIRLHNVPLTITQSFLINQISGFYNLFIPGEVAGSVVKWYRLSVTKGKKAEVFATILFLRLINTAFVMVCGALAVLIENPFGLENIYWIALAFLGILAGASVLVFKTSLVGKFEFYLTHASIRIPEFITNGIGKVFTSLRQYRDMSKSQSFKILSIPVISYFLSVLVFFIVARSLDLRLSLVTLVWICSLVYFIVLVPASISGIGLREGALVFVLPHYGVEPVDALAFSLILFGFHLMMSMLGGLAETKRVLAKPLSQIYPAKESKQQ